MKNQFPPNLDDDNPLFKTDGFRMFCFKVLPCSKRFCHDWTTCPFSHPAEKAKRRDPRVHTYTGVACPEMKKNTTCPRGDSCSFAHNVFEYWLHPSRYRSQLCNDGINCNRKICFFAHTLDELRVSSVKVVSAEAAAKMGAQAHDAFEGFDPFSQTHDDGLKGPSAPRTPVGVDVWDQNSNDSSRRSSMSQQHQQLRQHRMSMDQALARPHQHLLSQHNQQQRNSIDMAELQLRHLHLAAMKAQLMQQSAALQQGMPAGRDLGGLSVDQLAQVLTQLQFSDQLGPAHMQGLLGPQQVQQLMMPNISQVLMQQVLLQQQAQQQQKVQEQLLQQLQGQMNGLSIHGGAGMGDLFAPLSSDQQATLAATLSGGAAPPRGASLPGSGSCPLPFGDFGMPNLPSMQGPNAAALQEFRDAAQQQQPFREAAQQQQQQQPFRDAAQQQNQQPFSSVSQLLSNPSLSDRAVTPPGYPPLGSRISTPSAASQ